MKYYLHNSNYKDSDVVVLGVPDNSGSRSSRINGVQNAPDYIRRVSQKMDVFKWKDEQKRRVESNSGIITAKVCDIGNMPRVLLVDSIHNICSDKKMPLVIGGDHSLTALTVRGASSCFKKIAFVYFDAHPDFRCGFGDYYGSVLCELKKIKNVSFKNSVLIGMRAPEKSELLEIKKNGLLVITPEQIELEGINKIISKIAKRLGKLPVYLSIDLDVVEPSFASGVDTPVPAGLTPVQIITLIEKIGKKKLIGVDIVELNPKFDIGNVTGHLASRICAEIIASQNDKH